ncbi:hypothetical protein SSS_09733 [Sarcoptes scabiei]|nr:hypothetical protein SSS_09733 [Sarcoptes scabiei]UXI15285.1 hypothetical protein NH340_JMT01228 [Sarcoptes scabiei]
MFPLLHKSFRLHLVMVMMIYSIFIQIECRPKFDFDRFALIRSAKPRMINDVNDDVDDDLQRNSARLHRTLFLLDTSDLLRKAKLFGKNSAPKESKSFVSFASLSRLRREVKQEHEKPIKHINIIKVRKPFLAIDEEFFRPESIHN